MKTICCVTEEKLNDIFYLSVLKMETLVLILPAEIKN